MYMRKPTRRLVINEHAIPRPTTQDLSEYGFTKLGTTPGGGFAAGPSRSAVSFADIADTEHLMIEGGGP